MVGRAEHVAPPQLPSEVVQQIFSTTVWSPGDDKSKLVLALRNRVQARAVCRSWNAYLDPKLWPIEELSLDGNKEADRRIADWICTTQPALRRLDLSMFQPALLFMTLSSLTPRVALADLSLYGQASLLLDALPAVCLFTRLNALSLLACPTFVGTLYLAALRPLSSLQNLVCEGWDRVELRASAVLPQLTFMESLDVEHVVLDAALPSLQRLNIIGGEVDLAGERLLLPQLSQLSLELAYVETADWHATPQLAKLSVVNCGTVTAGLTALARLTSLTLDWSHEVWDEDLWVQSRDLCHSLLQAAPPSVRHLHLGGPQDYSWLRVPALASVPHITSLSCRSPAIMAGLGPLTQLQHLEFPDSSVLALSVEHLEVLYRLTTLRRLVFGIPLDASSVGHRLQVLRKVLPAGCTLEQPLGQ